ncbi:MAG: hypothetical protein AAGD96_03075 [Chloroflexota bacterium]
MVKIDREKWPMVYIEVDAIATLAAMEEYNAEMDALLDFAQTQPEKFGMIYINDMSGDEAKASKREPAAKKLSNQWLKENRPRIGETCAGIAMVMPNGGFFMKMMRPIARRSMPKMMGAQGDMFFNLEDAEAWMKEQMGVTA